MTQNYALLPCPFCGGLPLVLVQRSDHIDTVRVECSDCKCSTPSVVYRPAYKSEAACRIGSGIVPDLHTVRKAVVKAWNTRYPNGDSSREAVQHP